MYGGIGVSASSLHRESTDSLILDKTCTVKFFAACHLLSHSPSYVKLQSTSHVKGKDETVRNSCTCTAAVLVFRPQVIGGTI